MTGRAALLAVVLVACKAAREPPPVATPPPPLIAVDADARELAVDVAARDAAVEFSIPLTTQAVVTVVFDDWNATHAVMQLWVRKPSAAGWNAASDPWPTVLGSAGAAWGIGVHGRGAPAGQAGPSKREGDKRTPAGVFTLAGLYGYAATPPAKVTAPYQQLTKDWKCIDDPRSRAYNEILDATKIPTDWSSAEDMRRDDEYYKLVVDIRHNPAATPDAGSCIFLHVWGGADSPTVGCIAMDEHKLAWLMTLILPTTEPLLVVLPRADYRALAARWDLPR